MAIHSARLKTRAGEGLLRVWLGIREWCGDAAYDRYSKSHAKYSCNAVLLTREEFYLSQLQKKYSRISRCC
jgi:uncharacterized short protein YbdD (DUF466 family)